MKRQPDTWEALKTVVAELNDLMPLLTAKTERQTGRDADRHIYWMVRSDGEDLYAVGCNYEAEETTADIPLPEGFRGPATEVPTGRQVAIADSRLTDHFDPFQTRIYRLGEAR